MWSAVAVVASMIAVAVSAGPAAGQPGPSPPSTPAAEQGMAKPPPLPPDTSAPTDPGRPDLAYDQSDRCVEPVPGGELPEKPWGQIQLRFDQLHRIATGKGQAVAVIDTGVNRHDFLGDRLAGGGDYVVAGDNGLQDCDGHGTQVAGIIAANPPADSGIGFMGIAPDATIVSIRQTSAKYQGTDPNDPNARRRSAGTLLTLAQAIVHAAKRVPHGVMNISVNRCRLANEGPITADERQVQEALRFAVEDRDVVVVTSAGNLGKRGCPDQNNGPDPNNPAVIVIPSWFSEHVLSVAAIDRTGDPAPFSVHGPWVSVAAPGTKITSLNPANSKTLASRQLDSQGKSADIEGTSFAAPYVAGTAALVRERFPMLNARQVMYRIKATASHPAATGARDDLVGHGMINPIGALTAVIPAEQGITPDRPIDIDLDLPPPSQRDHTPTIVALIGSTAGGGALLLTLFVIHAIRRNHSNQSHNSPPERAG